MTRDATHHRSTPRPTFSRERKVTISLALVAAALTVLALGWGDYPLGPDQVVQALVTDAGFDTTVVRHWRLPRVTEALVLGAALAVAGALFQSLTRNPLGSPDVIGFTTGSYSGALIAMTLLGSSYVSTALGALVGGLATAILVYLLAYRGGVQGFRLIIVGIGVTAMLHSFNTWLLLRVQTEVAMSASMWGMGSISTARWSEAWPVLVVLTVLAPLVWLTVPALRQLELGDDAARAHGVRAEPARLVILLLGISLTATATATAGPIAFIALSAPQVARRLMRSASLPLVASALTGAVLLLAADLIAQHLLPGGVPVGVVTVVVGGLYLLALLAHEARRRW